MGYSEGHGSLVCCIPWGHRVRQDLVTERYTTDDGGDCQSLQSWQVPRLCSLFFNLHLCGNSLSPITVNVVEYC